MCTHDLQGQIARALRSPFVKGGQGGFCRRWHPQYTNVMWFDLEHVMEEGADVGNEQRRLPGCEMVTERRHRVYKREAGLARRVHTQVASRSSPQEGLLWSQRPSMSTASMPCIPRPGVGPALRSSRRYDSLEEPDDGFCEDVIPITGDHMGGIRHVHILGVRALLQETLRPCFT